MALPVDVRANKQIVGPHAQATSQQEFSVVQSLF